MAPDAICSSFASKSLNKSSLFLSHYNAPKLLFSLSFQHSVHTKRSRKRRPSLHFACLSTQNSLAFDVISTHEDSDGSFLFRFGDPSEVVKIEQLEKTNLEVGGKGNNDEEDLSVLQIIDSDRKKKVTVKKIDSEEKSENSSDVIEGSNHVVESESRSVFKIESSTSETSSSSSVEVQVLVSGLSLDNCDSSELDEQVDDVLRRTSNSVESDVEGFVHVDGSFEVNGSSGSDTRVENVVIGEERKVEIDGYESLGTSSPCPSDRVSEPEDEGASAETVRPPSGKELISLKQNRVVEVNRESDNIKEQLIRNDVDRREAWLSMLSSEHGSGPKDHESSAEITESLTGRNKGLVSSELDPVIEVPADDVNKENSKEKIVVAPISNIVDAVNVEAGTENSTTGEGSKSEIIEILSVSSPLEAKPAFHEEGNGKNVEGGTQNDIMRGSSERELIEASHLSPPLEAEPALGEERDAKFEEVETQDVILAGEATIGEVRSHNDISGSASESEGIGTSPLSLPSETEPILDEGGATIGEVGRNNDITDSTSEGIGTLPLSPPSEADPVLDEGGARVVEVGTQNDVMEVSSESEVIETLPPSLPSEAESVLEEGGAKVVEAGTQNDVMEVSSVSEVIGTLPLSLLSEAESFLEEGSAQAIETGTQNDVTGLSSESEAIGDMLLSPPLEDEPILDQEGDTEKVEYGTESDINRAGSGSEIIPTLHPHTPLEVQPVLDNKAELEQTEIFDKSLGTGTAIMIDTSSEIMEVEINKENVGTDGPVEISDNDKTVSKPIRLSLQSEKIHLEKLILSSGTASLPHPEKALAGGEDACFTCKNWLGVADGVSRWSLEGVDHGKYAQEVMDIAREIVSGLGDTPATSPEEVLNLATVRACYPGSSTVLISHLDGKDLHVANIGDSGVIILRNGAVWQRSSPMFHEFNFPVLVERSDDPSKLVERYKFYLDEGDIVVAATDGLFDNLYEQEIISTVSKSLEADKSPKEIAEILAMRAHEVGSSTRTRSPFSDAAQAAGYTGCTGGKLDDVVVVVSLVKKGFDSHAS